MPTRIGAEIICDCLKRRNVDVVFGIPGMHTLLLFEALRQAGMRVVTGTHEQGTAFMANGYSRATGRTGVFLTCPGPGLTNAFTGIAESLLDSCPVVGIVAAVDEDDGRRYHIHEMPQLELVRPIVKNAFRAESADDVDELLGLAFDAARLGEPGPAILEVTTAALRGHAAGTGIRRPAPVPSAAAKTADVDAVVERLKQAKRVALFVGQGAANAASEVTELAEWLSAPVASTSSGRGCLPEDHALSLGFGWRPGGLEWLNEVLSEHDLVLAIGAKLSEHGTRGYRLALGDNLIHVDACESVLGANYAAALSLAMPAETFLAALLARKTEFGPRQDPAQLEVLAHRRRTVEAEALLAPSEVSLHFDGNECHPDRFFAALRRLLAHDDIVVTDSGYHELLAMQAYPVLAPRTLLTPSDFESTGYCIPAAIGAALACPRKRVVAIVGDGGFAASGFELLTAVKEDVNLLTVVFNDGSFGLIKRLQETAFGASYAAKLCNPDFERLAESLHLQYRLASGPPEEALGECLALRGPTLLEVPVAHSRRGATTRLIKRSRSAARQALLRWRRPERYVG